MDTCDVIRIRRDESNAYLEEIEELLGAYDRSFIGSKRHGAHVIYAVSGDAFRGAMVVNLFWDWLSVRKVCYRDRDILRTLVASAQTLHDDALGIHLFTTVKERFEDFQAVGFGDDEIVSTPQATWYFSTLRNPLAVVSNDIELIISERPIEPFHSLLNEAEAVFQRKHGLQISRETVVYTVHDAVLFIGGLVLHLYQDRIYVHQLFINPAYRGRRLGTRLMDIAEQVATKRNIPLIELKTAEFQARAFYERLGYRVVHTMHDYPKGFDCYTMIKTF